MNSCSRASRASSCRDGDRTVAERDPDRPSSNGNRRGGQTSRDHVRPNFCVAIILGPGAVALPTKLRHLLGAGGSAGCLAGNS